MEEKIYLILPGCDDTNRGDQALIWQTVAIARAAGYDGGSEYFDISLPKFIEMAVFYGLSFACVAAVAVIHLVPIVYMIYDTISGGM